MLTLKKNTINSIKSAILSSDIATRMVRGTFWSFTGTAIAKAIVLISGIICAHILGKDQYGELGMIRSTISMFTIIGFSGLGLTATKYIAEFKHSHKERIFSIYSLTNTFACILGVVITSLVIYFAPLIATISLNSPYLVDEIRLGGLLLFITILDGAQQGTLSGFEDFKSIAINTLIGSLFESALMLTGAYYYGVGGAVFGFGFGYIALYIANIVSIRKNFKILGYSNVKSFAIEHRDLHLLYKFSLPAALSALVIPFAFWLIKALLVRNDGYGALAIFDAADQWKIIILFIPTAVSQIVLPILSGIANVDTTKFWKVLWLNIILNGCIALVIAIIISLFSGQIMRLYGNSFDYTTPLILLAASTVFTSVSHVIGMSISSRAKMWIGFSFNIIWALILILCSYLFINKGLGATGIALSVCISYIVHTIIQFCYVKIITKSN